MEQWPNDDYYVQVKTARREGCCSAT